MSDLAQLESAARSEDQAVRFRAVSELLQRARADAGVRGAALRVFQGAINQPRDYGSVAVAIEGLELISGPEAAREVRLRMFEHPQADMVAGIVRAVRDPSYVWPVLYLMSRRKEPVIQVTALHALGRWKAPEALGPMLECLSVPELRPHAIDSLADLGDERAIPYLEPMRADATPVWRQDTHGPMLRVCDLAEQAIRRLGVFLEYDERGAEIWGARPAGYVDIRTPRPGAGMQTPMPPPRVPIPRKSGAAFLAFVPLIAAVVELSWAFVVLLSQIGGGPNHYVNDDAHNRVLYPIIAIPTMIGVIFGVIALAAGGVKGPVRWVFYLIGMGICVATCVSCFSIFM